MFFKKGIIILILIAYAINASADEKKPCLIFQGNDDNILSVALDQYNRIRFNNESMLLSSSDNPSESIELFYSTYNKFRIGESTPSAAVEEVIHNDVKLIYNPSTKELIVDGDITDTFHIEVFNVNGMPVAKAQLSVGETLSLQSLSSGIYIAVAVGRNSYQSLKLVK